MPRKGFIHEKGLRERWDPLCFSVFFTECCQVSDIGERRIWIDAASFSPSFQRVLSSVFMGSLSSFWYVLIG